MPHGNSGPVSASTAGEKCGDFCGLKTRMNDEMSGFWCVCLNMSQLWIRFFLFSNENPRLVAWLLGWLNPGASHARMDRYTPSLLGTNTVQQIIGAGRGHRWCHFVRHGWYIGILNQRKDYEAWHGTHEFLRLCCHFWNAKFPLQGCLSSLLGRCSHLCESSLGWPRFFPVDAQIFGSGGGLSVRVGGTVPEGCSDLGSAWMEHRSGLLRQSSGEVFEPYLFWEFWGLFSIGPVVCVEDTDLTTTWLWHTMAMPSLSLLNNWIIWCIHWQGQCFEHTCKNSKKLKKPK